MHATTTLNTLTDDRVQVAELTLLAFRMESTFVRLIIIVFLLQNKEYGALYQSSELCFFVCSVISVSAKVLMLTTSSIARSLAASAHLRQA